MIERVRAILVTPDGADGMSAFFNTEEEAFDWIDYYLEGPGFEGYSGVIESIHRRIIDPGI